MTIETVLSPLNRVSVADSVFEELHRQILTLELKPGVKISEAEVAKALGVSRQPVRDAFYRLFKLGFLNMKPQVATTISLISEEAVEQARFIRCALETKTNRVACDKMQTEDYEVLKVILDQQRIAVKANDTALFHTLDDRFHRTICERCNLAFAWDLIKDNKAHMDRVRFLSLAFTLEEAFAAHLRIYEAIKLRDKELVSTQIQDHLRQILSIIPRIREQHPDFFLVED
ncbi:GntR family transcriptional regulator [Cohaesibacter celericrescens]|uniref:GntR family transcriptional regulator n=1 Tax=Cohaesibacter celericrescens TaxID=2067669 RepID=A0A2N5XMD8_9HYPH|nr:GntR family transcriptional regulator [Cohaesibacter celericrescens]PLW75663.1 GntR family transcriptional regulator [Cohaesibacter celericrescens]